MKKEELTYSEAIAEVEAILEKFNTDQMSVDELGAQVKRATELITYCKARLRQAETAVNEALEEKTPS